MALDTETVARIARLARLHIDEADQPALADELSHIMTWIEELNSVNVDGVEPMTRVVDTDLPMRDDQVTDGGYPDQVVANAPEATENFFVVPKVVE